MNSRELVAWNMRRLRVDKGISQQELASAAGIDRTYVSRLERVMENPSVGILEKVATTLDVHIGELFAEPGPEAAKPQPLRAGRKPSVGTD